MAVSEKNKIENQMNIIGESYDRIPYTSYPFEYNRPENLRTIGVIFGMTPPKLATARVLELGCAEGGNIIRFAESYPKSYTLGIDLSKVEINQGQENIKKLKLSNIELKHMSITDLDESYGKFDYIICHGVYSWVPDFVREKILEVSSKLLNKNGIAFVSYNTLPGWNMINTVRELMLYHASNFTTEEERIGQAKLALNFLKETLDGSDTPHAKFMSEAANLMSQKEDNYIRHEYLAEENKAFYFHQFVEDARKYDLNYLGDTDLHRMYTGNLPQKAAEQLSVINDIVRTEQYIDFIKNTQFRCTLLCHKDTVLSRNINFDKIKELYLTCNLAPEITEDKDVYASPVSSKFYINNNKDVHITVSTPALKALLYTLFDNLNNPISIDDIVKQALKKAPNITKEQVEDEMAKNVGKLVFLGYFKVFADKPIFKYTISDKPKISAYAMFQVGLCPQKGKYWFTNQINHILGFEDYQLHILKILDGKHTIEEIKKDVCQKITTGIILANRDNKKVEDEKEIKIIADALVMKTLDYLRINYALVD